ncbi:MAG TPA: TadE/TadG family type IV pilus assembly protein, partial [Afipia sp.]
MSSFKGSNTAFSPRAILSRFGDDKRGNVAVIFAITLLPILGLIGAAVDYSRANNARTALQTALDTTALMISRDAVTIPPDQIQARAQQYFNALYTHNADAPATNFVATYTPASAGKSATIAVTAKNSITTDFMKVMGAQFQTINLNGASTTTWGSTRLRVALALDNTGSMQSAGKMPALKKAAKDLIDSLSNQSAVAGDLMISIVPFAKDVNVGSGNYQQSWIKWSGQSDTWEENNGTCSKSGNYRSKSSCESQNVCSISGYTSKNSCQSASACSNPNYTDQNSCLRASGKCSKSQYNNSYNNCVNNNGTWNSNNTWSSGAWGAAVWTPNSHSTWTGCVTDRDQDYD